HRQRADQGQLDRAAVPDAALDVELGKLEHLDLQQVLGTDPVVAGRILGPPDAGREEQYAPDPRQSQSLHRTNSPLKFITRVHRVIARSLRAPSRLSPSRARSAASTPGRTTIIEAPPPKSVTWSRRWVTTPLLPCPTGYWLGPASPYPLRRTRPRTSRL